MARPDEPLIIIADDSADVIRVLRARIEDWRCRVLPAATEGELTALLAVHRPALVLLDLQFGETDGLELLRRLKETWPELPVALLTGYGSINAAVSAMRYGAYDFLTKPPDPDHLRSVIENAVGAQRPAALDTGGLPAATARPML